MSAPRRTAGDVEAAGRALLETTEALDHALEQGDDGFAEANEARERAFADFRGRLCGPLSAEARGLVERVVARHREALARAEGRLGTVREELARARRSHGAARALEPKKREPRFFSERA